MLPDLFKHVISLLRGRTDGFLKLLRKGWNAISDFFRNGVGSMLMPNLEPEQRASIARFHARAVAVIQERAEKEAREHAQTQMGRAEEEAAKKASAPAEKAATAEKAAVQKPEEASAGAAAGPASATTASATEKPSAVARVPSFGANATIRTAEVFKVVAPVAVRALVRALADTPVRPAEAEAV